ncbi:MAG: DUF1566 domain-containing protein [Calditrichia bacterium]|nr:DUF1566 domain-containing protein [Calditrichia bacterium]
MEKKERLCFVIMPFKDDLKEVYWKAIRPACLEAGFEPLRVDELKGSFNINKKIIQHIFNSEAIISDLTGWNPNVFYEMGVAHAIGDKTVMIIQRGDKLPFDVSTYNCIIYEQSESGLETLKTRLIDALRHLEQWRSEPTNPVQDYKPPDAFAPRAEVEKLQTQLRAAAGQLKNSVSREEYQKLRREYEKLRRELEAAQKQLSERVPPSRLAEVEQELAAKSAELARALKELEKPKPAPAPPPDAPAAPLRSQPVKNLSGEAAQKMLAERDFYDKHWNPQGKGFPNQFEKQQNGRVVYDRASGLLWQQAGSLKTMISKNAQKYIAELNREKFAGYGDWRLPTLEEAMSLVKPEQNKDGLYIDPVFAPEQGWIWTADEASASVAWVVSFGHGGCDVLDIEASSGCVRGVRSGQSSR